MLYKVQQRALHVSMHPELIALIFSYCYRLLAALAPSSLISHLALQDEWAIWKIMQASKGLVTRQASCKASTDANHCAEPCRLANHAEAQEAWLHHQKHHPLLSGMQPFFDPAVLPASCSPAGGLLTQARTSLKLDKPIWLSVSLRQTSFEKNKATY